MQTPKGIRATYRLLGEMAITATELRRTSYSGDKSWDIADTIQNAHDTIIERVKE